MADTYTDSPEYRALDEAARAWFARKRPEFLTTGWVLLGSSIRVAEMPDDVEASYRLDYITASGTNVHTSIGMLTLARGMFMHPYAADDE